MKNGVVRSACLALALVAASATAENVIKFNNHGHVYATFGNGYSSLTDALSLGIWVRGVRHSHANNHQRVFIAGVNQRFELSLTSALPARPSDECTVRAVTRPSLHVASTA